MHAVVMHRLGDLEYKIVPTPHPGTGEVLVRIHATTVNRADLERRSGRWAVGSREPTILGLDLAGEIVEIGEAVQDWQIGERIVAAFGEFDPIHQGTYAEFIALPIRYLHRIPADLDYIRAASAGLAFCTAWSALFYKGGLQSKAERVVIWAAASGVGTSALQIAHWYGATTIAVASPSKVEALRSLGASIVIDPQEENLVSLVMEATDGLGATLVLNLVGQHSLQSSVNMLSIGGRIVCAGCLSSDWATINTLDLIQKQGSISGALHTIPDQDFNQILHLLAVRTFQSAISLVLPLHYVQVAHDLVAAQATFGKVILVPTWIEQLSAY